MSTAAVVCTATLSAAGCGGGSDSTTTTPPSPARAFYLTASSGSDLRKQTEDHAARFAREQGRGHALMMLDFGAARYRRGSWGVSLRSGTFFTNDEIHSALQAAADGYEKAHEQGTVTIVYVTTNAALGDPGHGYRSFNQQRAREAGEQQVSAIRDLKLSAEVSVAVGGDIEPGYDFVASPDVSVALVAGAVEASGGGPYYNVGTAPCAGERCIRGWTVDDICDVSAGGGRQALPEVYFAEQASSWAEVQKHCSVKSFAGASASPLGDLSPSQSWRHLRDKTGAEVGDALVVWPG